VVPKILEKVYLVFIIFLSDLFYTNNTKVGYILTNLKFMPNEERTYPESLHSQSLKLLGKTYYFDVKEAKNGKKYLTIAETRLQEGVRVRNSLIIFDDQIDEFCKVVDEMHPKLKE